MTAHLKKSSSWILQTWGLYIPPMVWASQHEYTEETKLLVFASQFYDPDDYIRDYSEFLKLCS